MGRVIQPVARAQPSAGQGAARARRPFLGRPPRPAGSVSPALPLCSRLCQAQLTGQGRLFEGDEHRAHPGHILALLAALGVEIAQLGHLLPLRAWALLLGLLQECFLRGPAETLRAVTGRPLSKETLPSVLKTLVPAFCPFTPADELGVLCDSETRNAQVCLRLHSPKTSFIQGCWGIHLLPTLLHPPEQSPKRQKSPRLCVFNVVPQRHSQELYSSPKTPAFGDTELHHPPSGTSAEPSTSQHPPPRGCRQCWGRDPQSLRGRAWAGEAHTRSQ